MELAKDPEATNFEEYKLLFEDKDWEVRLNVKKNQKANEIFPDKYSKLIPLKYGNIPYVVASNPKANF